MPSPSQMPAALQAVMARCLAHAHQALPSGLWRFNLNDLALGWVHPMRLPLLQACWPELQMKDGVVVWAAQGMDVAQRSLRIAEVAAMLRQRGAIAGWRDEPYACERPVEDPCVARGETLFELERAAFRWFGFMSRAVHINGFLPGARMVCGRRALTKPTDPGKLDNLAAGGLPAGEDLRDCARRELWEEAGVPMSLSTGLQPRGQLRSVRMTPDGLHDEVLHIYSLTLPLGFSPSNQDGEVSEFLSLDLESLTQRLQGDAFSIDAAAVVAWGLMHAQALSDLRT